ncbi:MAG: alpha/beta fold hydrolase [Bacteroidota bacterium]
MKNCRLLFICILFSIAANAQTTVTEIPYGNNNVAGNYITLDGAKLYYEVYGKGEPLVLIHGNGGNIEYMKPQIEYFSKKYKVIVPDCRGRGKSELGNDSLTYAQMAKDISGILDHLKIDSAYIVGRSDGGILTLLLAIDFPKKVKKAVAFAANLSPDTIGLYPFSYEEIKTDRRNADEMLAKNDTTKNWKVIQQRNRMMEFQPHITKTDLGKIKCPVLVMTTDRDVIPEEHSLFIYRNIQKGNLCILTGEKHSVTKNNPELFNSVVAKYLTDEFKGDELRR